MLKIHTLTLGMYQTNTYIIHEENAKTCCVIDPGYEADTILDKIEHLGLKLDAILLTHGHFDHTQGVKWLKDKYGVQFACSSKDQFLIDASSGGTVYGLHCNEVPAVDVDLDAVADIEFGNTRLSVIKTPGHTPGHVSLYNAEAKVLFTGDTLFRESIGRTDLPGGDYSWIMKSILDEIIPLGDDVKIYPGHEDSSTIGHETLYNPFVTEVLNNEINYKG